MTDPYGFDPFAQHPFYAGINHSLVQRAIACLDAARPTGELIRIVDLASGTGAVTQLILDELERLGRPATVLGIEPSHEALELASERLQGRAVQFIHGDADQLTHSIPDVDLVCLCNAIRLIPDKPDVIHKIMSTLAPGSYVACNTTFFTGAQTPEGERFAHRWIRQAVGWLRRHHPDLHPARRGQVASHTWLSADEYVELLETQGLQVLDQRLELAMLPLQAV
jgi:ubiquinone/menaquinone biosynthesis C-methylase UbiE